MLLGRATDPPATASSIDRAPEIAPKAGPKMSALIPEYLKDREEGGRANKWTLKDKIEKSLAEFVEIIGDVPVNLIEYEHMKRFRDLMQRLPTKRTVRPAYRGKTVTELLAMDIPADIRMSGETVSQHVGRLSTFFEWCIKSKRRTLVTENPAKGLEIKTQKRDRAPLSAEDLRKLFSSDYYTGNGRRACYVWWLPLLGIYTGARISELVSNRCDDVYEQDGVPLIRIRGTKTDNAARVVAVHSKLIELGFMRFVAEVRLREKTRVLFDAPLGTRTPGKRASEMVMRVIRGAGISSTDKVFHSTRHLVNQELVEGNQNLVVLQAMMGHSPTNLGMTANYLDAGRIKPAVLKQAIEIINYGVDLSHLVDGWERFVP